MSFRPDVIADGSRQWAWNALRFATRVEAEQYVADLAQRWTAVRKTRVTEVDDPVNSAWSGQLVQHLAHGRMH